MNDTDTSTEQVTPASPAPAPASPASKAQPDFDVILAEINAASTANGLDVHVDRSDIQLLELLMGGQDKSFLELFGNATGTAIQVDGHAVPNYQSALDAQAKYSMPTVRTTLKKIKAIQDAATAVRASTDKLKAQITKAAESAVRRKKGGREYLELASLFGEFQGMSMLTNPLEIAPKCSKRVSDKNSGIFGYVTGSAIAPCAPGGHDQAVEDLIARVADHSSTVADYAGVQLGYVARRVDPVPGAYTDTSVAVAVYYSVYAENAAQFRRVVTGLASMGELSTLDPEMATDALLRYNTSFGLDDGDTSEDVTKALESVYATEDAGDSETPVDVAI